MYFPELLDNTPYTLWKILTCLDDDETIDSLEMAMLLIHARFHIDSEVEINASTEDAFKAVLFKKKGFEPALMPPRISKMDMKKELYENGVEEYLFSDNWNALLERDVKKRKFFVCWSIELRQNCRKAHEK